MTIFTLVKLTDAYDFRAEKEKFIGKVIRVVILNVKIII